MNSNKHNQEKKIRNIFFRYLDISSKPCTDLSSNAFLEKNKDQLEEYITVIERVKKLKKCDFSDAFLKSSLDKIYDNYSESTVYIEKPDAFKFRPFIKPSIIFISASIVFLFAFSGFLFAAQKSLPGSSLYPVKRYGEDIKMFVTPDANKNILHYQLLNNRLNEAKSFLENEKNGKIMADSSIKEKILKDAEEEFDECKKYNYFGEYTEEDINGFIEQIKEGLYGNTGHDIQNPGDIQNDESKEDNGVNSDEEKSSNSLSNDTESKTGENKEIEPEDAEYETGSSSYIEPEKTTGTTIENESEHTDDTSADIQSTTTTDTTASGSDNIDSTEKTAAPESEELSVTTSVLDDEGIAEDSGHDSESETSATAENEE